MLGDINIAEPNALIGFAGPRVVKETIGKDLPEGFQRSEFLLGMASSMPLWSERIAGRRWRLAFAQWGFRQGGINPESIGWRCRSLYLCTSIFA